MKNCRSRTADFGLAAVVLSLSKGKGGSSAKAHVSGKPDGVADTDWLTDMTAGWVCTWRKYLRQDEVSALGETLRRHESTGRPLGEKPFVRKIGLLVGRDLLRQRPGPKTKKQTNKDPN